MKNIFMIFMLTLVSMVVGSSYANAFEPYEATCDRNLEEIVDIAIQGQGNAVYKVAQARPLNEFFYIATVEPLEFGIKCTPDAEVQKLRKNITQFSVHTYRCNREPKRLLVRVNKIIPGTNHQLMRYCSVFNI